MMSSRMDEDTVVVIVTGILAAGCFALAVRYFSRGRFVIGGLWTIGGAAFAFVAYFFATFTMKMF